MLLTIVVQKVTNSTDVKDVRLFGENSSERIVGLDNKLNKIGGWGIIMKTAASKDNLK